MDDPINLIYIVGRGRSGSTVLAELIGNGAEIQNVGELVSSMNNPCGCGLLFTECDFWQQIRRDFERISDFSWDISRSLLSQQAYLPRLINTLFAKHDSSEVKNLTSINRAMIQAIRNISGKRYVLDASKEITRALFLMRHFPNVQFLHLIRKPENIIASYLHRIKQGNIKFLRRKYNNGPWNFLFLALISISWVIGNILVEFIRFFSPARVLRVRYEDLCDKPEQELQRLGVWLNSDFSEVINIVENEQPQQVGHIIAGNYRMQAGTFVFDPRIGKDRHLSWVYASLVKLICWPLKLFYGYSIW